MYVAIFGPQPGLSTASSGLFHEGFKNVNNAFESSHFEASATRLQDGLNLALNDFYTTLHSAAFF